MTYERDINKVIWSRGRRTRGIVTNTSTRYCAACQSTHTCYIAKWEDGSITKPCTAGVKCVGDELEIM